MRSQVNGGEESALRPLLSFEVGDVNNMDRVEKVAETSKFTHYLAILNGYSGMVDAGTATDNDFAEYSKLGPAILDSLKDRGLEWEEYRALNAVYYQIHYKIRLIAQRNRSRELSPYTMTDWEKDGTFKALPGQEVDQGIYTTMYKAGQPQALPLDAVLSSFTGFGLRVGPGFLTGTPYGQDATGRILFPAFGIVDDSGGTRYYYLGLVSP